MQMTKEFESDLLRFMELREIKTKSEAIRVAVEEGLKRELEQNERVRKMKRFLDWIKTVDKGPENPNPRFKTDDDVFEGMP